MDILRNPPGFRQFAKQVADLDEATENLMHFSDQKWEKLQHMSGLLQDWYSRSMSEKFEAQERERVKKYKSNLRKALGGMFGKYKDTKTSERESSSIS